MTIGDDQRSTSGSSSEGGSALIASPWRRPGGTPRGRRGASATRRSGLCVVGPRHGRPGGLSARRGCPSGAAVASPLRWPSLRRARCGPSAWPARPPGPAARSARRRGGSGHAPRAHADHEDSPEPETHQDALPSLLSHVSLSCSGRADGFSTQGGEPDPRDAHHHGPRQRFPPAVLRFARMYTYVVLTPASPGGQASLPTYAARAPWASV